LLRRLNLSDGEIAEKLEINIKELNKKWN